MSTPRHATFSVWQLRDQLLVEIRRRHRARVPREEALISPVDRILGQANRYAQQYDYALRELNKATDAIAPDDVYAYKTLSDEYDQVLRRHLSDMIDVSHFDNLMRAAAAPGYLERLEEILFELADIISRAKAPVPDDPDWRKRFLEAPGYKELFESVARLVLPVLQGVLIQTATLAITEKRALERALAPPPEPNKTTTSLERVQRMRRRRARGVAAPVTIDLYFDDIELLRRFGYLAGADVADREALAAAVETFLMSSFLTYFDKRLPLRERLAKQKGRLAELSGREDEESSQ